MFSLKLKERTPVIFKTSHKSVLLPAKNSGHVQTKMVDKCHQETLRKLFLDKQRRRHALVASHVTAALQCSLQKDFSHCSYRLTVD